MTSANDRHLAELLEGPTVPMASIPVGDGGPTGVFTIWYRGSLLSLGRSTKEPSETGNKQADAVATRLRMVLRQPHLTIQRAIADHWPKDFGSAPGPTNQKRVSYLLKAHAECRIVRLASGAESQALYDEVREHLLITGLPLADQG